MSPLNNKQNLICECVSGFSGREGPCYLLVSQEGSQFKSFTMMALPASVFNYQEQVDERSDCIRGHHFYPKTVSSPNYYYPLLQIQMVLNISTTNITNTSMILICNQEVCK